MQKEIVAKFWNFREHFEGCLDHEARDVHCLELFINEAQSDYGI